MSQLQSVSEARHRSAEAGAEARVESSKPVTVLLRSAWQTVNIGDIAHTPGLLRILEAYWPDAQVILWPNALDRGVEPMLRKRFPNLRIVRDSPHWRNPNPREDDPTAAEAFDEADLMIHGSAAAFGSHDLMLHFHEKTGKPYGAYGVTVGDPIGYGDTVHQRFTEDDIRLMENATFIFTRETRSLQALREEGIQVPYMEFVPDATFALDIRNEVKADALMAEMDLRPDEFICVIPRLRYTPYWEMVPGRYPDSMKQRINDETKEHDIGKLREIITGFVRATGMKVLIVPEVTYQVDVGLKLVYPHLPADVKERVVCLDRYWITDEAASVYSRARAVFSMDCHSPIIAVANNRPGLYLRQPTDTWKGQMYPDLGLGDWVFEIEEVDPAQAVETLLQIHSDYDAALAAVQRAREEAHRRFRRSIRILQELVGGSFQKGELTAG